MAGRPEPRSRDTERAMKFRGRRKATASSAMRPGPAEDDSSGGKEFQGAMSQKQSEESKQDTAGMEAPGQQNPGHEDGIVIEADGGGRNGPEGAAKNHTGGQQEYASGQHQGLERFLVPEIHACLSLIWSLSAIVPKAGMASGDGTGTSGQREA